MFICLSRMYCFGSNPLYSKIFNPQHYAGLVKQSNHTLSQSTKLLLDIYGQRGMTKDRFKFIWKKYVYYVVQMAERPANSTKEKIEWLDVATKIQHRFKSFTSQHLTKAFNRMQAQGWKQAIDSKNTSNAMKIIRITSYYNPKKATALFLSQAQSISQYFPHSSVDFPLMIMQVMVNCKLNHPLIRQLTLDALYPQIDHLNSYQFSIVTSYISWSPTYINKQFLRKAAVKLTNIFKSGNISDYQLIRGLAGIANVQVRDNLSNVYMPQIDKCVDTILPYLSGKLAEFNFGNLNIFISIVRRLKHYDSALLSAMAEECMKREIKEFKDKDKDDDEQGIKPYKLIELAGLFNMLHCLAIFNERNTKFITYILNILSILTHKQCQKKPLQITQNSKKKIQNKQKIESIEQNNENEQQEYTKQITDHKQKQIHKQDNDNQDEIGIDTFSRILYSLCILCPALQLIPLSSLIDKYFQRLDQLNEGNCLNFYYGYLYLRAALPKLQQYISPLFQYLSTTSFTTRTSKTQKQICSQLVKLGVPAIPQFNLHNISCDIFIPEYQGIENIVIDIHGFHHFTRNEKRLLGGNILKMKLLDQERYKFQFISLDQWLVIEDKAQFISEFVSWIRNKYGTKKIKVSQTAFFSKPMVREQKVRQPMQLRQVVVEGIKDGDMINPQQKAKQEVQQQIQQQAKASTKKRGRNTRSKLVV